MHFDKRSVILVFVALFAALAGASSVLVAAYSTAIIGFTIIVGLTGYSLVVAMRNWQLNHPHLLRHHQ
jgi:hypothetical protein